MTWLLAAVLFGPPPPSSPPPSPPRALVERYEVDDGLPQNSVISMIRTRDGYLWLGTWAGLVRFDGVRFTPVAEGLTNSHIVALLEDRAGAVWIGTGGGGVARWTPEGLTTFTSATGLMHDDVWSLGLDAAGHVWVATAAGVSVIADGRFAALSLGPGVPRSPLVRAMVRHPDGRMLLGTDQGICAATGLEITCPQVRPNLAARIVGMTVDASGRILVTSPQFGVAHWNGTAYEAITCEACRWIDAEPTIATLPDGALLVGVRGRFTRMSAAGVEHYGAEDGIPDAGIKVFLEDPEGSLWVGTDGGGLVRLRAPRVRAYGIEHGLSGPVITSIVQDVEGTIWAGSRQGPPVAFTGGDHFERRLPGDLAPTSVAVLAASSGALWVGTVNHGLIRWQNGRAERLDSTTGLGANSVRALFEDRDGVLWIALAGPVVHRISHGALETLIPGGDLDASTISAFAQTPDGRLWAASNAHGLYLVEGKRFTRVGGDGALPSSLASALIVDSRGALWIGTADRGLYRMRNDRFEPFGIEHGLPDPVVAFMLEDRRGDLWVATSRGISRLQRDRIEAVATGASATLDPMVLGKADGMRSTEGSGGGFDPSGLVDREGRLWFSTLLGIVVVDPANLRMNTVPPPVAVEYVTIDERRRAPAVGTVRIPAGTQQIEIAYTGLSMADAARVRFRYRLEGFDSAWHDAGPRRSAFYTNLPPARYRFEVLAANNDGVWSPAPAAVLLDVAPLWWQRLSVQVAGLLLLLVATGAAVRAAALRRTRARLAALERSQALTRERTRIARDLHDDIGARLTHLALLAGAAEAPAARDELASVAQETARTMDELVWSVNAANDTVEGLVTRAIGFAETHGRAAGLRCRFDVPPSLPACELGADTRRHVFLAFKEAINNAVKHAHASELRVAFAVEAGALIIEVIDNGTGLPEAGTSAGNGLRNLRDRMAAIGGQLALQPTPGGGTTVRFSVPLHGLTPLA